MGNIKVGTLEWRWEAAGGGGDREGRARGGVLLVLIGRTMPLSWPRLHSSAEQGIPKVLLLRPSQLQWPLEERVPEWGQPEYFVWGNRNQDCFFHLHPWEAPLADPVPCGEGAWQILRGPGRAAGWCRSRCLCSPGVAFCLTKSAFNRQEVVQKAHKYTLPATPLLAQF